MSTFGPPRGPTAEQWDAHEAGVCWPCIDEDHAECHGLEAWSGLRSLGVPDDLLDQLRGLPGGSRVDACPCEDEVCVTERRERDEREVVA